MDEREAEQLEGSAWRVGALGPVWTLEHAQADRATLVRWVSGETGLRRAEREVPLSSLVTGDGGWRRASASEAAEAYEQAKREWESSDWLPSRSAVTGPEERASAVLHDNAPPTKPMSDTFGWQRVCGARKDEYVCGSERGHGGPHVDVHSGHVFNVLPELRAVVRGTPADAEVERVMAEHQYSRPTAERVVRGGEDVETAVRAASFLWSRGSYPPDVAASGFLEAVLLEYPTLAPNQDARSFVVSEVRRRMEEAEMGVRTVEAPFTGAGSLGLEAARFARQADEAHDRLRTDTRTQQVADMVSALVAEGRDADFIATQVVGYVVTNRRRDGGGMTLHDTMKALRTTRAAVLTQAQAVYSLAEAAEGHLSELAGPGFDAWRCDECHTLVTDEQIERAVAAEVRSVESIQLLLLFKVHPIYKQGEVAYVECLNEGGHGPMRHVRCRVTADGPESERGDG